MFYKLYIIHSITHNVLLHIYYCLSCSSRFSFPRKIADLNNLQYSSTVAAVSSLPGTGYVSKFGLQFESTIPTVGIPIFAESRMPVCCNSTSFMVFKNMQKSGRRVTAPNCLSAFVNIPPRHLRVCAYSPHSKAVLSTK